jgi:hypothetical protein
MIVEQPAVVTVKALAHVRRLQPQALQVDVGDQQLNVVR